MFSRRFLHGAIICAGFALFDYRIIYGNKRFWALSWVSMRVSSRPRPFKVQSRFFYIIIIFGRMFTGPKWILTLFVTNFIKLFHINMCIKCVLFVLFLLAY